MIRLWIRMCEYLFGGRILYLGHEYVLNMFFDYLL